ncbi:hypothetical protein GCM10010307_41760 [Streptomyces vastus]|uniref:Uncharacterized protein n=1 Tax=Streptomyces vastus TaxID=285451 RepID=A0ABP6DF25_9ACTN
MSNHAQNYRSPITPKTRDVLDPLLVIALSFAELLHGEHVQSRRIVNLGVALAARENDIVGQISF